MYGIACDDDGTATSTFGVSLGLDANFLTTQIYYLANCAATTNTSTFTPNNSANISLTCQEYSGVVTVSPLDKTATGTGFGTAATSASSGTLTQADELVVIGPRRPRR
jgi:hypothetical protein